MLDLTQRWTAREHRVYFYKEFRFASCAWSRAENFEDLSYLSLLPSSRKSVRREPEQTTLVGKSRFHSNSLFSAHPETNSLLSLSHSLLTLASLPSVIVRCLLCSDGLSTGCGASSLLCSQIELDLYANLPYTLEGLAARAFARGGSSTSIGSGAGIGLACREYPESEDTVATVPLALKAIWRARWTLTERPIWTVRRTLRATSMVVPAAVAPHLRRVVA